MRASIDPKAIVNIEKSICKIRNDPADQKRHPVLVFPSCRKISVCQPAKSIWCHTHGKKRKEKSIFDYKMYISYLCCYNHSRILLSSIARPWQGYMGFTDACWKLCTVSDVSDIWCTNTLYKYISNQNETPVERHCTWVWNKVFAMSTTVAPAVAE